MPVRPAASPPPLDARLADAAAALALLDLAGRCAATVRARRAAVQLASPMLSARRLAELLRTSATTVKRWRAAPRDEALFKALRRQLRFRRMVEALSSTAAMV